MPDPFRVARQTALVSLFLLAAVSLVRAQEPLAEFPVDPEFMSRFDFHLSAAALSYDDDRFSWDTHWGGDFDLVDYVVGRATFVADYQALLGSEFRPFDPYQGNYTLEAEGSIRVGRTEIYGVLNHVSRHLGDRFKRIAVAENSIGPRVVRRFGRAGTTFDVRAEARKVIARAYVDYTWIRTAEVTVRHAMNGRAALYGRALGDSYLTDPALARRSRQDGGRLEGGVRITGRGGAIDLFAGYERVVDADPLDRVRRSWAFAGFRLIGR